MPLRDHFRPPISRLASWGGLLGLWPGIIVARLSEILPPGLMAEPNIRLGSSTGDVHPGDAFRREVDPKNGATPSIWTPPAATLTAETDRLDLDEYEVRVYEREPERRLVATVEIVSPANKDRPSHREAFLSKCVALLQQRVSLAVVDVVTTRRGDLHQSLLDELGLRPPDQGLAPAPSSLHAFAFRPFRGTSSWRIDSWSYPLEIGRPLPTLPLWLSEDEVAPLELETTYEKSCQILRIIE